MLEQGRREQNLLSGLWVQILLVAVLVFAYTQAVRQLDRNRERSSRLQEQLTVAREEVARQGARPDLKTLQAEVETIQAALIKAGPLEERSLWLEALARERFTVQELSATLAKVPSKTREVSFADETKLAVDLYELTLTGKGTSRNIAGLLHVLQDKSVNLLCPLTEMKLKALGPREIQPVGVALTWLLPSPSADRTSYPVGPEGSAVQVKRASVSEIEEPQIAWGRRTEPFLTPFERPNAFAPTGQEQSRFHLSGIIWDPERPACVINETSLTPGEWIDGFQVVLLTPRAALLQKGQKEIFLPLE